MNLNTNIFDAHELYNLVCAQHSATMLEKETGFSSDWSEFVGHLQSKFNTLESDKQERLDELLKNVAEQESNKIIMLQELNLNDFNSADDFFDERKELQIDITNGVLDSLKRYWNGE